MSCQLDTSRLVELLQQSAVEHLMNCRHLEVQEFDSLTGIITTDFEALYAYKCGEYQRCLQLSTHNVHTLLVARATSLILPFPFIQLMDDSMASLIGLTLIVYMSNREDPKHIVITQLSLSLYLMSQCQMRLHHSATSLAQTLHHIKVASGKPLSPNYTLEQLLLKLTQRLSLIHI